VISNKIKLLAIGIALLGAATVTYACDGAKKGTTASSASTSADGGSCAAKHAGAKTASAEGCAMKAASGDACAMKGTGAKMAGADGCCAKDGKSTMAYGKTTVMATGACPTENEANYAFYVAGAECKDTGSAVVKAVKSVKGVGTVTVDYDTHMLYVCADRKTASKQAIEKSLKSAGYAEVKFVDDSKKNCARMHGKVEA
jgi:copper chaperone CopZ